MRPLRLSLLVRWLVALRPSGRHGLRGILAVGLLVGAGLLSAGTVQAQNPVSTVTDNQGNQLMQLFDNGNLTLLQNGKITTPGDIESTGGAIILQDGTTLSSSSDLGQLSLPFSGSASNDGRNGYVFQVENTGSGDGLRVLSTGDDGLEVEDAGGAGVQIRNGTNHGVFVDSVGNPSSTTNISDKSAFEVEGAEGNGLSVGWAAKYGVLIEDTPNDPAIRIENAGETGIFVNSAGFDGISVSSASFDGIRIAADDDGITASGDVDGDGDGLAGNFDGDVDVSGNLSKGGGSFKIDHPQDPTGKYLQHGFVESPQMTNIYKGNVTLDASGEATVQLPDYFESINRNFQYQLTAIGAAAPRLHVAEEVSNNTFRIAGGEPNMKVSWQITAVRDDAWAQQNRIEVVKEKPDEKQGTYRHPEAHGAPESAGERALEREERPQEQDR